MTNPYNQGQGPSVASLAPRANPVFTGSVQVPAGTAAAPGLAPAGDADTGLSAPAANTLSMSTGGTERLRVASDGSVRVATGNAANRALTVSAMGMVSTRYDDNGTPENLSLSNFGLTGLNQGNAIAWSFGTGGNSGGQAARIAVRTSDTWSAVINRSAHLAAFVTREGNSVERLRIESDGTISLGGPVGSEAVRVTVPSACVNYCQLSGAATGGATSLSARGSDANIDLQLSPKGTGRVRFGDFTAGTGSIAGHIEVRDAAGTLRKLAVLA